MKKLLVVLATLFVFGSTSYAAESAKAPSKAASAAKAPTKPASKPTQPKPAQKAASK